MTTIESADFEWGPSDANHKIVQSEITIYKLLANYLRALECGLLWAVSLLTLLRLEDIRLMKLDDSLKSPSKAQRETLTRRF